MLEDDSAEICTCKHNCEARVGGCVESVCGALTGSDSTHIQTHFNIQDYEEMGHVFCETLFEFLSPTSTQVSSCSQSFDFFFIDRY